MEAPLALSAFLSDKWLFRGTDFRHFRGDKLNGSYPYHRSGRYQKGQSEKEKRLAHDLNRTNVTGVARLRPCLVTTKPR